MSGRVLSSADIIAIAAAVIAILAMAATFWQAAIARHHNKLSVRPLLVRSLYRTFGPEGARFTVGITNVGVGPAVIKDRYFTHKGSRLSSPTEQHPVLAVLQATLGSKIPYNVVRYGLPALNGAIAPQTELVVFEVHFPTLTERTSPMPNPFAQDYVLVVQYESLYEETRMLTVTAE